MTWVFRWNGRVFGLERRARCSVRAEVFWLNLLTMCWEVSL